MIFIKKDDDLILAYEHVYVHVACAIHATGYNKTSENISNHEFNLQ